MGENFLVQELSDIAEETIKWTKLFDSFCNGFKISVF